MSFSPSLSLSFSARSFGQDRTPLGKLFNTVPGCSINRCYTLPEEKTKSIRCKLFAEMDVEELVPPFLFSSDDIENWRGEEHEDTFDMFYGNCGPQCEHLEFPSAKPGPNESLRFEAEHHHSERNSKTTVIFASYYLMLAQAISYLECVRNQVEEQVKLYQTQPTLMAALSYFQRVVEFLPKYYDRKALQEEVTNRFYSYRQTLQLNPLFWIYLLWEEEKRRLYELLITRPCRTVALFIETTQEQLELARDRAHQAKLIYDGLLKTAHDTLHQKTLLVSKLKQAQSVAQDWVEKIRCAVDAAKHVFQFVIDFHISCISSKVTEFNSEQMLAFVEQIFPRVFAYALCIHSYIF